MFLNLRLRYIYFFNVKLPFEILNKKAIFLYSYHSSTLVKRFADTPLLEQWERH